MKNNKGFISVSIIYSFFLVFIAIVLGLVAMYTNRRILINKVEDEIRESFPSDCIDEGITELSECILFYNGGKEYIESQETPDFSIETSAGEYGLYTSLDDYGTSYYFRGDVVNNYVQFGINSGGSPMYWRIVRINGDGTVRLVYDGTRMAENGEYHTVEVYYGFYNNVSNNKKHVGYTYDDGSGMQVNSSVKAALDVWYENNILDRYSEYIADVIFCNDKSGEWIDEYGITLYAAYNRINFDKSPSFICSNKNDRYTVSDTTNGNGLLTYPIALLTADEICFAGASCSSEARAGSYSPQQYYLFAGGDSWTMTPFGYHGGGAQIWYIRSYGYRFSNTHAHNSRAKSARPVINLRTDVKFTGNGTIASPYIIEVE